MLDQVSQILHLLLIQLVHVRVRKFPLMVHAARVRATANRRHDNCLILLAAGALVELARWLCLMVCPRRQLVQLIWVPYLLHVACHFHRCLVATLAQTAGVPRK